MKITLFLDKPLEWNAARYFEAAKKAKKKLAGAEEALAQTRDEIAGLEREKEKFLAEEKKKKEVKQRKKEWYEKFRWFISSDGFLVIGGRDATSNEVIIKKHTDAQDVVFHTEAPGSPFCVIKATGKEAPNKTIEETAQFCLSMSKAWQRGIGLGEVYWVKPEQVSKKAQSGEYLSKGAFMIYGKKNLLKAGIGLSVGVHEGKVMCGPPAAVANSCSVHVGVLPGEMKKSDAAKKILHFFEKKTGDKFDLDEIMQALPPGECKVVIE